MFRQAPLLLWNSGRLSIRLSRSSRPTQAHPPGNSVRSMLVYLPFAAIVVCCMFTIIVHYSYYFRLII